MTDLRNEISKIENESSEVKFKKITEIALQRNELLNLLSGEDIYIQNSRGDYWLKPSNCGGPTSEIFNVRRITNQINNIYKESGDKSIKSNLSAALSQMLNGTPLQFYYAICVYSQLASLEDSGVLYFSNWVNDDSFVNDLHPAISDAIKLRKAELLRTKILNIGLLDNLYEWCILRSQELVRYGFNAIIEG